MPDKNNIRLWVEALRSGEFRQGRYVLREKVDDDQGDVFCCLGVACEVALRNGVRMKVEVDESDDYSYDNAAAYLPARVREWLGLDTHNPIFGDRLATEWNDASDADFGEIADRIEEQFLSETDM